MATSHLFAMRAFAIITLLVLLLSGVRGIHKSKYGGCISQGAKSATYNHDIALEVGGSTYVDCVLNETNGYTSENLNWSKGSSQIIDSKTLRLSLADAKLTDNNGVRKCVIGQERAGLCMVKFSVGYKPLEVVNFSCLSVNLEYLDCTWRRPNNPVKTNYSLVNTIYNGILKLHPCAVKPRGSGVYGCNFTIGTCNNCNDWYDIYKDKFVFEMTGKNALGSATWKHPIEHYSRVQPKEPIYLNVTSLGSRNLSLKWRPPVAMTTSGAPKLVYRVRYTSTWNSTVTEVIVEENSASFPELQPSTWYHFSIAGLSNVANPKDESMWGPPAFINVTTKPDVPDAAPQIIPGSFQVISSFQNRDVTLYWKGIEEREKNGPNFSYTVTGTTIDVAESEDVFNCSDVEKGSTTFCGLSFYKSYKFILRSQNVMGFSNQSAEIILNRKDQMLEKPNSLTVIAVSQSAYNISWVAPKNATFIEHYVLFQASSSNQFRKNDRGILSWIITDNDTMNLIVPVENNLPYHHFGVATFGQTLSSDMLWNTCIISYNGTMGKLKTIKEHSVRATTFGINWSIDCAEKLGIIKGYNVDYCRVAGELAETCLDEPQKYFAVGANVDSATIMGVKPWSFYRVTVSARTFRNPGEVSNPIYVRTDEADPLDAAKDIQVYGITNTSFFLKWHPPTVPNGNITKFLIKYTHDNIPKMVRYPTAGIFSSQATTHTINITDGVIPYANYTVTIMACNKKGCSKESEPVKFTTEVGVPGQMEPPQARLFNGTHAVVKPESFDKMFGPNPTWELKIVAVDSDDNRTIYEKVYHNFSDYESMVYIPLDCENPSFKDNIAQLQTKSSNWVDDQELEGPWSDYTKISCLSPQFPLAAVLGSILGATLILTLILLAAITLTKRAKIYIKKITEVTVVMPSGLDDYDSFSNNLRNHNRHNEYSEARDGVCGSSPSMSLLKNPSRVRNISNETTRSGSSTEELLLKDQNVKNNWANDSIASGNNDSLSSRPSTAQTHLSSDSSMELTPSVPESPDSVFSEHPLKNPAMAALPTLAAVQMQNGNLFNPTLTPIGESQDGSLSRNGTPQHYSKFAGYCNGKEQSPPPVEGTNGYVAAPYSQFGMAASNPRTATFGGRPAGNPEAPYWAGDASAPAAQSYSKFGLGIPNLEENPAFLKQPNAASAPFTSTPVRNSVGYSVLGLGEEDPEEQEFTPAVPLAAGKGYVMAAALNGINPLVGNFLVQQPVIAPSTSKVEEADPEPTVSHMPMSVDSDPAHKRSPSNSSSLTAGYCRFGLSRPTSMSSESGHYVPADPGSCISPSKSSSCRTSVELPTSPYHNGHFDSSPIEEQTPSGDSSLQPSNGYASVQQLLKSELNS